MSGHVWAPTVLDGWETPSSSFAPHLIGHICWEYEYHSSLAPSKPLDSYKSDLGDTVIPCKMLGIEFLHSLKLSNL